jgi:hypothetical protein
VTNRLGSGTEAQEGHMNRDSMDKEAEESKEIGKLPSRDQTKSTTSQTMSGITTSKDYTSTISKTSSPQAPPKLGFSIAQIMGFMSRGVNFKNYDEPTVNNIKKEDYDKTNAIETCNVGNERDEFESNLEEHKATYKRGYTEVGKDTYDQDKKQNLTKIGKPKLSKHDTNLWRPQPCRKYINNAAFQAGASVSTITGEAYPPTSVRVPSTNVPLNGTPLLSPSVVSTTDSLSHMQQNLPFHTGNPNIPLQQHPDLNTIALLRQYSLMNLSNPWKTASFLSSYSNLLGLHNQISFQNHQKNFIADGNVMSPPIGGLPYPINNNSAQSVSNLTPGLEMRNLPPPLSFISNNVPDSMPHFDLRASHPEGVQTQINRPISMNNSSCTDNNRSSSSNYPQGYSSLKLSENNVKNNHRSKSCITDGMKTSSGNSDNKALTKNKQLSSLDSTSTEGKSSAIPPKTFPCAECGKIFNAHYNLTRHMPVHTGKSITSNKPTKSYNFIILIVRI